VKNAKGASVPLKDRMHLSRADKKTWERFMDYLSQAYPWVSQAVPV
jgi:hypothetical protein